VTDEVRERHGVVASSGGYVDVREGTSHVTVSLWNGNSVSSAMSTGLTPAEARYLASRLRRLARLIDEKQGVSE
jgi:hypothetical protein